ncbi:MAG: hypothetical protein UGF89_00260, partial [Acutalibacteraceae bacterium]|nr:hypothetical protein [Acutalibacteraceae bacterium]
FSTFAYMVIRQDLQELITKRCIVSEQEMFANDLLKETDEKDKFTRPADFSAFFVDENADSFSTGIGSDIKKAFESFFKDERVTAVQKRCVKAFLYNVIGGYNSTEAALIAGSKNVRVRNDVTRGREILKSREEFKCLWENANLKSLAS